MKFTKLLKWSALSLATSSAMAGIGPIEVTPSEKVELECYPVHKNAVVKKVEFAYQSGYLYGDAINIDFINSPLGVEDVSLMSEKKIAMSKSVLFERDDDRVILGLPEVEVSASALTREVKFVDFEGEVSSDSVGVGTVQLDLALRAKGDQHSSWTDIISGKLTLECVLPQ